MKKIEFMEQMKIITIAYSNEYTQEELEVWYNFFEDMDYITFKKAVNEIIKKSKYKPSINELLNQCQESKEQRKIEILDKMKNDGYFKNEFEYEKTSNWLKKGIIPEWLKNDMKKYSQNNFVKISYNEQEQQALKELLNRFN